jgi:hypothetical protein
MASRSGEATAASYNRGHFGGDRNIRAAGAVLMLAAIGVSGAMGRSKLLPSKKKVHSISSADLRISPMSC